MLEYTSGSAAPVLDDRARMWVRDLELKARNFSYLADPNFLDGYQVGYEARQEYEREFTPTFDDVIQVIENSLSRKNYKSNLIYYGYPYAWYVGSIFGYLAVLLQSSADQFPFLVMPVSSVHAFLAT